MLNWAGGGGGGAESREDQTRTEHRQLKLNSSIYKHSINLFLGFHSVSISRAPLFYGAAH